ncbi:quinone oxidoreductase [Agrobacterium tumefaciens]|uniref:quinone oxidoreductase family protein n=1 Tax=Agrobacterium tumefaciens TaxID=358 RepID=UPI0015735367|nr:quinone oxidoreductase [Agrobacterium tumefaciens]NTB96046.1 quinone oxidoreductase [Agrobacterium tumefaciens]NTC42977.1 quinone oxidoreductase [Agrobacterium tumefaciens]
MEAGVIIRKHGGPEVLEVERLHLAHPGAGELRLRQTFIGVNFHDIYVRSGLYKTLDLPGIPGIEGAGLVEEIGPDVFGFSVGDRVAYVTNTYGCYASSRLLPARLAVKIPDGIEDRAIASVLLKGLTVEMLVNRVCKIREGDWVLVQAAAGAVGQLLVQWATRLGARVIGTVGSREKIGAAVNAGCSHVILYRENDVAQAVMDLTGGLGVKVAYDGVGKDSFDGSLDSLASFGQLVNFGQASGGVEPFMVSRLANRSASISRPVIFHYVAERYRLEEMSKSLFSALSQGWLKSEKPHEFPLAGVADAHRLLESRQARGSVILTT